MTKHIIALAIAAAFGIAHAADAGKGGGSQSTTVGADSAIGNVPQTTEPIGTNAPDRKGDKSSHKKPHKTHHKKANKTDAAPAAEPAR